MSKQLVGPKTTSKGVGCWLDKAHGPLAVCPPCGLDVTTVGLTSLVYSFRSCSCGAPEIDHLVEQLWHVDCFVEAEGDPPLFDGEPADG